LHLSLKCHVNSSNPLTALEQSSRKAQVTSFLLGIFRVILGYLGPYQHFFFSLLVWVLLPSIFIRACCLHH